MNLSKIGTSRWLAVLLATLAATTAVAADFPTKRLNFFVGYPPGGTADRTARVMAEMMAKELGQPAIVENKNGAAQAVAAQALLRAEPDGHTVLVVAEIDFVSKVATDKTLGFRLSDFASVCGTATTPYLGVVVKTDARWKTIDQLVAEMKSKPGMLTWGTAGEGSGHHRTLELVQREAGVKVNHIPYNGGGPAITDLLGGQIDVMGGTYALWRPHIDAGKVRVLLIQGSERIRDLPGVPTFTDKGWSPALRVGWMRLIVHKNTPAAAMTKLVQACEGIKKDPKAQQVLRQGGAEPVFIGPRDADKMAAEDEAAILQFSSTTAK